MNTNLNILVVDDSANHRRSAELLLKGHTLTIVGTYDDAQKALTPQQDRAKFEKLKADGVEFSEAWGGSMIHPKFDVVLIDLLMPASRQAQGDLGLPFVGKEMPIGTFLILLALSAGVKNIGMVTDTNHHNHPASAALDPINRKVITVGETKIFATNYPASERFDEKTGEIVSYEYLRSDEGKKKYPENGYDNGVCIHTGTFVGKGWDSVLETLLTGKVSRGD